MRNTKHNWTNEDLTNTLNIILRNYNRKEWSEVLINISTSVGTSVGSVKALYTSFKRISQGYEANPTKGGVGHNWGQNVEDAYNQWVTDNAISNSKINVIFS